jgi:membrane-bound ClpP family serine protease
MVTCHRDITDNLLILTWLDNKPIVSISKSLKKLLPACLRDPHFVLKANPLGVYGIADGPVDPGNQFVNVLSISCLYISFFVILYNKI